MPRAQGIAHAALALASLALVSLAAVLPAAADRRPEPPSGAECHVLDIEDPGVLFLLRQDVQGEVLVLTREALDGSPGATDGNRAYLGRAAWHRKEPMHPFSWVWSETVHETEPETRSIRVGFALPLWGIVWKAVRTDTGLEGEVAYHDDVPEGPPPTSRFTGTRVPC